MVRRRKRLSASAELSGSGQHTWTLAANPYYTRVRDYIDADPLEPIGGVGMAPGMGAGAMPGGFELIQFTNHSAEIYGADISGSVRLFNSSTVGKATLEASAGWVRGTDLDSGVPLYHMAPLKGRVRLSHALGSWASRLEVVAADAKTRVDTVRMEPATPAYTLVNVATGYAWRNLKLELGVDNLFDKAWAQPLGGLSLGDFAATGMLRPLPGRGRSANLGLTARF